MAEMNAVNICQCYFQNSLIYKIFLGHQQVLSPKLSCYIKAGYNKAKDNEFPISEIRLGNYEGCRLPCDTAASATSLSALHSWFQAGGMQQNTKTCSGAESACLGSVPRTATLLLG